MVLAIWVYWVNLKESEMFASHSSIGRPYRWINALPRLTVEFTQTNVLGFKKILKKFDKHFRYGNLTFHYWLCRPQSTGLPSKAMVDGPTKHSLVTNANPRHLSFSMSPPSALSPPQSTPMLQRRYSLSAEGKSLWATVTSYKFVTTEKDEVLLHRARQVLSP